MPIIELILTMAIVAVEPVCISLWAFPFEWISHLARKRFLSNYQYYSFLSSRQGLTSFPLIILTYQFLLPLMVSTSTTGWYGIAFSLSCC